MVGPIIHPKKIKINRFHNALDGLFLIDFIVYNSWDNKYSSNLSNDDLT